MACNYSNKFLPLVQSIARRLEGNLPALEAELANLFTNPEVALADVKGQVTFASEQKDKPVIKEPIKINTRQATIGVQSGSSIASAYLGRSDAYSTMIKDFRRKILEMARIKINFETGIVENIQANADQNGISVLNRNIFDYKLSLLRQVLKATNNGELFDIIEQQINNALADKDFDLIDSQLNGLIDVLQMLEDIPAEVYDAYVILSNFDKLLKQECPFIEIDSRYDNSESIKKYEYIGANVSHFTGWTSSEFADSMDQASMLVKSILDYIPEVNEAGNPIQGSSIGLSGFYSVMTAMRNTLLYHADESLLQLRKNLLKGVNVDMVELIDAYIKYLQNPTQNTGNVSSFFDSHKTYLIGKLKGIRNFIFNSNIDKELKDIFNNMFFKNVQMSYVAYTYDMLSGEFGGTDLKANAITQQAYTLSGTIASAIYNWRTNPDSFKRIIYVNDEFKGERVKYRITKYNRRTGEATILYNGKEFTFGPKSISTTFDLAEFKSIFFDLFGYMIPDDFETVGKQINGGNNKWDYRQELGKILRLGLQGGCFKWGSIEYENEYPTNLQNWYSDFANVGKIISTIYGADTVNVVKNVSKKNNLPLFGLNSLAYNFPFIMWNHMDSESNDDSVYEKSFLFDKVDSDGKVIAKSIVGEPKVRSEVMYEGKLKSASKLTVAEVAKLSILDDFYRNFINPESDHIYLQNATFADKGTHFLVNYNLNTAIYGDKTLRQLIDEQMKSSHPNRTNMFNLIYNSRSRRIKKLVENILEDYSKVFTDGTFTKLSDIDDYIRKHKLSHTDVKNAFLATEGVNFYEEIHLSKGKVNETIALYYDTYTDKNKLAKRLDEQRAAFAKDLAANRVKMATYMDSISKQIGNSYKDWVADDGTIILSKEENGKTVLHPVLEGYFMANDLLSNEYNEVMIGGVYAHSKNTESSRLIAQIKRSVIFGATMHSFAQGLDNGVADEVHIACMPDVQAYVQNIVGTEQTNDSMDGSGLCTMLQARLESNSLLDARVGYDKKSIGHDIDSRYGRPSLLKWAVYAMTNARRRIAYGSNISQETLCRKAYSHGNINLDVNELNEILAKIGPVYFKDVDNTGKYYKIVQFRVNESGQIERALQEVTANGTELNNRKIVPMTVSNTLWDIDQLFGGAWAMTLENGNLEYSESNVDALEAYVIKHQDAKTKQIGYIVNKSAMKVGVGNLNSDESWTDDSGLHTITMRTRYIGVQMDAEHHLDENEVTEMTQMISALSENGYTSSIVNSIYTDIGNVIMEALKEYDDTIATNDPEKVYKLLGELFIKSFENNDRDTLGLAQAFVLKASKALKESGSDFRLPFSAETVNGLFVSTVSSLLTKKGIRRKYEGFAGVLTPSYNMMQYYNVGGQTMMYERFTDLVREKGIQSLPGRSAVKRAINDIYIDGELNPFLEPIDPDKIDFEDTVVIFNLNPDGSIDRTNIPEPIYIQSFTQYDAFKHMDMTGKVVYNFTSRPKNLKATNTKFKVAGVQHSVYELDSVRAMFYYKQGTNSEFVSAILASRGYTAVESNKMFETLQKIVQQDLRNLEKGRDLIRVTVKPDGTYVTSTFKATDVQVTPAQLITGRYHAKEFMMEQHENISDVLEKKEGFFIDKLRTKYNFTDDEPDFTEMVLFSKTGERYLVQTASESDLKEGYSEDKSIEKINGTFYLGEEKITNLEGVRFCKYRDEETGKVWNVIIVDSETTKRKLYRSSFFEFYRHNYKDQKQIDQEHIEWKKRIERRASRMYKSFMEQRKMLGTRIPTQAMQSFMPMEIVGYTDSAVNDVYVPVQQFFLQGSKLNPQP